MISKLSIDGFKSLRNVTLNPTKLNILVGPNASGKSSVLQTLLLLRQSTSPEGYIDALNLSGELYEAGTPVDAIHPAAEHAIKIELADDDKISFSEKYIYNRENEHDRNMRRLKPTISGKYSSIRPPEPLYEREVNKFAYLNAERIGPRVSYSIPSGKENLSGRVGKHGEYTSAVLTRALNNNEWVENWNEDTSKRFISILKNLGDDFTAEEILSSLVGLFTLSNTMLRWIIPGATFQTEEQTQTDSTTLSFIRDPYKTKAKVRTTHVGFGLSYALPVIVAGLSLEAGGLFLVENPEAHLHPYSQSRMGVFLALCASINRQIFVETHSDHVVNGIRLAVKKGVISPQDVKFFYFDHTLTSEHSKITEITTDETGHLDKWPKGFFDQIEHDLSQL
jgi:predicted ATPase